MTRPQVTVVTNVGVAHMEVFGSWEKIVEASAEPVEALGVEDVAVLNADTPECAAIEAACRLRGHRVLTYGKAGQAPVPPMLGPRRMVGDDTPGGRDPRR